MAYETTDVAVEKSQGSIRKLLAGFGAAEFQFGEGTDPVGVKWAGVTFTHSGHMVMVQVPLKIPDEAKVRSAVRRARSRTELQIRNDFWEQESKRIWRVLFWSLKSRMIAVEEGVEEFEQAFLAHIVDPASGQTVWGRIKPAIDAGVLAVGGPGLGRALERGSVE